MAIELTDDGTLDTVLRCSACGEELRYNYDGGRLLCEGTPGEAETQSYDDFVNWAIEDVESEHKCSKTEDGEMDE